MGLPHVWGSGSSCHARLGIVRWHKSLPKSGTEGAVVDSAADLQQEIGAAARPAHLLRLVHPAVHQEIDGPFGDGRPHPQAGTVTLGIVHRPRGLTDQIAVQRQQRAVHSFRDDGTRDGRSATSPWKACMTLRMRSMLTWASLALPFHRRQRSRSTSVTITAFASRRAGVSVDKAPAACSRCCRRIAM